MNEKIAEGAALADPLALSRGGGRGTGVEENACWLAVLGSGFWDPPGVVSHIPLEVQGVNQPLARIMRLDPVSTNGGSRKQEET